MIEAGGEKVIAKVIVDVPLMQTDKPYSYQIPSEFEDMVEAGMRVHVPFGKGNRLIQGIVNPIPIRFHQNLKIWLRRECEFMSPLVKGIASFKGLW